MRRIGGVVLTVTGFLACPCHLIITLPLLISLLAGTAVGSFLSRNTVLVYTGAGIYFVVALALGAWFLFGPKRQSHEGDAVCPTCASDTHVQEQSSLREDLPATRR
jgi:mercuric ion transport protein